MSRGIIIPYNWLKEHRADINQRSKGINWAGMEWPNVITKKAIAAAIAKALHQTSIEQAVVVLPVRMESMTMLKHWPGVFIEVNQRRVVLSLLFADEWNEVTTRINDFLLSVQKKNNRIHFSCQYQSPYTNMLDDWKNAGVTSYHPGDYFKEEILHLIRTMRGHWFYAGHSDSESLRGYHNLSKDELLQYRPAVPLSSTIWFSCSTLGKSKQNNIALQWWKSGATHCLLASSEEVNTIANQRFNEQVLRYYKTKKEKDVATILQALVKADDRIIPSTYHLLGIPWCKIK